MGDVTHIWCRHEFQADVGNLSHLHMIIWNKDITSTGTRCVDTSLNRITASIQHAFDYVEDVTTRERLTALAWQYQQHRCTPKCTGAKGSCRYKCPFDLQDVTSYVKYPATVPENIIDLLVDIDLCTVSSAGKHELHPPLQGGKYNPIRAHGNSRTSAFLAINFQATLSHSNTQVVLPYHVSPLPPVILRRTPTTIIISPASTLHHHHPLLYLVSFCIPVMLCAKLRLLSSRRRTADLSFAI